MTREGEGESERLKSSFSHSDRGEYVYRYIYRYIHMRICLHVRQQFGQIGGRNEGRKVTEREKPRKAPALHLTATPRSIHLLWALVISH